MPPEHLTSSYDAAVEETVLADPQHDLPAFALAPTIESTPISTAEAPLSDTSPHTTRRRIAAIVTCSVAAFAIGAIVLFPQYRSPPADPVLPASTSTAPPAQLDLPQARDAPAESDAVRAAAQPTEVPNAQPGGEAVPATASTSSVATSASPAVEESTGPTDRVPDANASAPPAEQNATASGAQPDPVVTVATPAPLPSTSRSIAKAKPANRVSAVPPLSKPASHPPSTAPVIAKPPNRQPDVRIAQPKAADRPVPCNDAAIVLGFCSRP